ncbi:MAG: amidophosphoribosyltransferase [Candidatus Aureabacteria bacterium]|nr:amidophosphoribosyltransferase [Candidatus Auribacterota bacterium]
MDLIKEECGVIGVFGVPQASYLAYQGIYAMQHRGQESAGILSSFNGQMCVWKGMGLVSEVFQHFDFDKLPGSMAIAHNRYSTTGGNRLSNAQPLCMETRFNMVGVAHNGNLINAGKIRKQLQNQGAIFQTSTDSEVIIHLLSRNREKTFEESLKSALSKVKGSYCITAMSNGKLIAARDPWGFRPLVLGKIGTGWVIASETCAFDLIGAEYVREIEPGEIVIITETGARSIYMDRKERSSRCVFEYVYFSRPDSIIFGSNCDKIRREMGRQLARESPCPDADIVVSVPDSSNTAALGFSEQSGIRFEIGLIRNHYVGRTFIKPDQSDRSLSVRVKFNPVKGVLKGKKIVLVEDSIVRGTTLQELIKLMKDHGGAGEVHVRVASPPVKAPCFFGIDFSTKKELIASRKPVEEIRKFIGADSLKYLSLQGMLNVAPGGQGKYCYGCFSGRYPMPPPKHFEKTMMENSC